MKIRSAAKAFLVRDRQILLNRCRFSDGTVYYDFPGGGQEFGESLGECVHREILEETGYDTEVGPFLALAEEVFTDPETQKTHPDYCHRVAHFFLCHITSDAKRPVDVLDYQQETSVWVPISEVDTLPVYPLVLRGQIASLIESGTPRYLGCSYYDGSL